jgi:hypothetical protein
LYTEPRLPFLLLCLLPLAAATLITTIHHAAFTDFLPYWAAARLFLTHANPYSAQVLTIEAQAIGQYNHGMGFHYPTWSLPLIAPFGFLSLARAQQLWLIASLALNAFSAIGLWRYFGGDRRTAWIALAVFATFTPLGTVEQMGQITPLVLASLTGFLLLIKAERWVLAGIAVAGFGVKPHLLWLVILAIVIWMVRERRYRFLVSAAITWAALWGAALLIDPASAHFLRDSYGWTADQVYGTGGALRLLFGQSHRWLQYVPTVAGGLWFIGYWLRHEREWEWEKHLPLLLIVSVASSPYGAFHDYILVLPTFVALAVRGAWRSVSVIEGWVVVQVVILLPANKAIESALSAVLWLGFWIFASRKFAVSDHESPVLRIGGNR